MENKKTCLYDKHVALGALMSPFGGFEMPIQCRRTSGRPPVMWRVRREPHG